MIRPFFRCVVAASLWAPMLASSQPPPVAPPAPGSTVVDVTVFDAQHKPVHNLTTADFVVLEDGHPQTIATFEEHNSWEAATPLPETPLLPAGAFTNYSISPAGGSVYILLLDLLNTPASAQGTVRKQVIDYLKAVHPGNRLILFGLTSKLILLQGLTSDVEQLSRVLTTAMNPPPPAPVAAPTSSKAPRTPNPEAEMPNAAEPDAPAAQQPASAEATPGDSDEPSSGIGNVPGTLELVANLKELESQAQTGSPVARAHYTLDALNLLAHTLANMPGRKDLIWFSASFPINILPDGSADNPFGTLASAADEYRETSHLLAQGRVAVYPVVADAAEDSVAPAMAQATGGEAIRESGNIQASIDKAIEAGAHYYTLSYTPAAPQEGGYRKIRIDCSRQGLSLSYRRGSFEPGVRAPLHAEPAASAIPFSSMRMAMERGGPDPSEIVLTASVFPVASGPESDPAPGNKLGAQVQGPFRRFAVQLGVDTHDLTCPTNVEGAYQCALEVSMIVYGPDGTPLNVAGAPVAATIPANQFAAVQRDGLAFRQDISVPIKGDAFLRIGAREPSTNKLGAVEFPFSAVSRLKPIPVTQPADNSQPAAKP